MKKDIVTLFLIFIIVYSFGSMIYKVTQMACKKVIEEKNYIMLEAGSIVIPEKAYYNIDVGLGVYDLAFKIIECESQWNDKAKNPASSAYGLGQFLNQTWDYIQNKWGLELDRNNKGHQLYATIRLLNEEGTRHWNETRECWSK